MLSFRYHALSLVAVFLALAIGVVLGVAIGDNGVVSGARRNLEKSLRGDVRDARNRNVELSAQLAIRNTYEREAYPALVKSLLRNRRIGIVAVGKLSNEIVSEVDGAVKPAGARLASVAVVSAPLRLGKVSSDLGSSPLGRRLDRAQRRLTRLGRVVGRQLVAGGRLPGRLRHSLFSSSRGEFGRLDGVVLIRDRDGLEGRSKRNEDSFESGLLDGLESSRAELVGAQETGTDPSQIGFMKDHGISSVDDLDLVAGQTALVYLLDGADEGNYGIGEHNLLPPAPRGR